MAAQASRFVASGRGAPARGAPLASFDVEGGNARAMRSNSVNSLPRGASHFDLDYNHGLNPAEIKAQFIMKVYGILFAQLALTTAIMCAFCFVPAVTSFGLAMAKSSLASYFFMAVLIGLICAMGAYKNRYPANLLLLLAFTLVMSLQLGPLAAAFYTAGMGELLLTAGATTMLIFGTLSIYVKVSKQDFSFLGGFLFVALFANIVLAFFAWLFSWGFAMWINHVVGVFIFSGYILFDTDQIVNKVSLESVDMGTAIWGATELYLDIVNLFIHILALLGESNRR
jgi:hypothetical protein